MNIEGKVLIIIPAHNEANNIAGVITEAKANCPFADILVVNDGSSDSTGEVARQHNVRVIDIPFWLGIGGTMQTGFIFAHQNGYEIAVQLDADGQHDPAKIQDLIGPIVNGEADVVIGSRFLAKQGYHSDFLHRLGIRLISKSIYFVTGQKFTDPTSGFRAANKTAIAFYVESYPVDYPEAEEIAFLLRKNFRVREIPAIMRPRLSGKSNIRRFHIIYYMVKVILTIFISSFGFRKS